MISVLGAGVAGLCAATALRARGLAVEVIAPEGVPAASLLAGGMLAPFCEGDGAPAAVVAQGQAALAWWQARARSFCGRGTLVIAPARDHAEMARFARATSGHIRVDPADYEPDLAGRFASGLFFAGEAHLDPVAALADLRAGLVAAGVRLHEGAPSGRIVDCRGFAARDRLPDLRAVRGEMLEVLAPNITLSRPLRLLHPRFPCYIVPRKAGRYMIGATMVESARSGPITARAVMELLSAAYTIHPGFAEAEVIATGVGLRPAFADNTPALRREGGRLHLNGLYRHGFLMAPVLAESLAETLNEELSHAH
jgi:glycine oxidase